MKSIKIDPTTKRKLMYIAKRFKMSPSRVLALLVARRHLEEKDKEKGSPGFSMGD